MSVLRMSSHSISKPWHCTPVSFTVSKLLTVPYAWLARAVPLANARQVSAANARDIRKRIPDVLLCGIFFIMERPLFDAETSVDDLWKGQPIKSLRRLVRQVGKTVPPID